MGKLFFLRKKSGKEKIKLAKVFQKHFLQYCKKSSHERPLFVTVDIGIYTGTNQIYLKLPRLKYARIQVLR